MDLPAVIDRAAEAVRPLIDAAAARADDPGRRRRRCGWTPTRPGWSRSSANLLTNAAKYTEEGGRITLSAGSEGARSSSRCEDTGVGIPPEMLPKVFDLFTQVDRSLARSEGGLGIGLTLVKQLVEMHGGTVTAASEPGKGSEFTVRLPLSVAAPEEARPQERSGCRGLTASIHMYVAMRCVAPGFAAALLRRHLRRSERRT